MTVPFATTLRALEADRPSPGRWLVGAIVLLALGGIAWFCLARVPVVLQIPDARIEVEGRSYPVEVPGHSGSVARSALELGARVERGQVLVELEAHLEGHLLEAERARLVALGLEIESTEGEREHQLAALGLDDRVEALRLAEGQAQLDEAHAALRASDVAYRRAAALGAEGLLAPAQLEAARARAEADSAVVVSRRIARERARTESTRLRSEREAEIRRLEGKIAHLRGESQVARAAADAYAHELEHLRVFSPIPGRLDWVADVKPGGFLQAGARVAIVVPDRPLHLHARFDAAASGRIRPGQKGTLRLDAFPWTEFGVVEAEVHRVGRERVDGHILVDLAILPESEHRIALQHGMTGTLEIEIERRSPLSLALRDLGRLRGTSLSQSMPASRPTESPQQAGEAGMPQGGFDESDPFPRAARSARGEETDEAGR